MCGIYGRWHMDGRPVDLDGVQRATSALRHRGPDDEGYLLVDTSAPRHLYCGGHDTCRDLTLPSIDAVGSHTFDLAFGFRRLAILDLTVCGHQPMTTPDERFTLVYNGEVYNYRELRAELAALGNVFRGESDTEVVLAAYAQWGPKCLQRFNGMWAIAVWDELNRRLFLSRDRFGVKPLYWTASAGSFAFASEIKALVGSPDVEFRPRGEAVYDFLRDGHLPSPRTGETFFEGIQALPPGQSMVVDREGVRSERYYEVPQEIPGSGGTPEDASEGYCDLLADSVRLRLRSDVPIGTCLSGGVDSSSIVAIVNRLIMHDGIASSHVGDRQKTFSAVYDSEGRYNEREYIETILAALNVEGNLVFPTSERLHDDLPSLVWHQDEPFGSTSIFAQWCVMAAVRARGVTVLLDGQGADEALAGYRPYDIFVADLLRRRNVRGVFTAGRDLLRATATGVSAILVRGLVRQVPEVWLTKVRGARTSMRNIPMRREFASAHQRRPRYRPVNHNLHEHLRELIRETSLPHLLRYEDRNSMAFGIEGRVPFLDYRLVEYALGEAFRWCIHRGWTKWPLRYGMRGAVPDQVLWRRDKIGFETPERSWLRAWLQRAGESHFGPDARSAPYLDLSRVRGVFSRYARGGGNDRDIWRIINLELWLRAFS